VSVRVVPFNAGPKVRLREPDALASKFSYWGGGGFVVVPIALTDTDGIVFTDADGVVLTYGTAKIKPTGGS
jgi:hypothetical protein